MSNKKGLKNKLGVHSLDYADSGVEFPRDINALTQIWSKMKSNRR